MNKKKITTLFILILVTAIIFAAATYAYYAAQVYKYGTFEVEVTSKGIDELNMDSGAISLKATTFNFAYGAGHDITSSAISSVSLYTTKASVEYCYNMNLVLPDEEVFTYTTGKCFDDDNNEIPLETLGLKDDKTANSGKFVCEKNGYHWDNSAVPELVLSLEKSNDNINYETIIDNMDITTMTGTIPVNNSDGNNVYHIKSYRNITTYNYYRVTVTLVYLNDVNQEENNHKSYHAELKTVLTDC